MQKETFQKIFQKLTPGKLIGMIFIGILLVILAMPAEKLDEALDKETKSEFTIRSELEQSLIHFLSDLEGVGKSDVVIYTKNTEKSSFLGEEEGEIVGVLISCEGAESYAIQSQIIESVSALFGISTNKIRVLKRVFEKE